ncbi:DEKNAAC100976 [Brettanomyces naardenensis]|uniref:DEKNAAC100976 n=1 Tax=Brettanomyces naardenensis TaxID=13370 RepID=A0A448YH58_BRENA|nr:DEKNAAC100976 [Brettanomyces naardenensis]
MGVENMKRMMVLEVPYEQSKLDFNLGESHTNGINFDDVSIRLDSDSMTGFINSVLEERDLPKGLKIGLNTKTEVVSFLPSAELNLVYEVGSFNFTSLLTRFEDGLVIHGLEIEGSEDGSEFNGSAVLRIPPIKELPFMTVGEIPSIGWDVKLPGCDEEPLVVLTAVNEEMKNVSLYSGSESSVVFRIPSLPDGLVEHCDNEKVSPVNTILSKYLNGTSFPVFVAGSHRQRSNVPDWMTTFVANLNVMALVGSKQLQLNLESPVDGIQMTDLSVGVSDKGQLVVNSNVSVDVDMINPGLNITRIKGELGVVDGETICRLDMREWCEASLSDSTFELNLDHGRIPIEQPKTVGRIISSLLSGKKVNLTVWSDLDAEVQSPFMSSIFEGIRLSSGLELSVAESNGSVIVPIPTLNKMLLIDSTTNRLSLRIDFSLTNPTNITFLSTIQWIGFQVSYMDAAIAEVGIQEFELAASGEASNASIILSLESDPIQGKVRLEEMMGKYLSGISPLVTIQGKGVPESLEISEVLEEISLEVKIPQFSSVGVEGEDSHGSIFILESTMHVMSSEVELTVYNPVENEEIAIDIIQGKASHEDTTLGYISHEEKLVIPPGIYKTPRIPVVMNRSGISGDILRKALNGNLKVETHALLGVTLGDFHMTVLYHGSDVDTRIRL